MIERDFGIAADAKAEAKTNKGGGNMMNEQKKGAESKTEPKNDARNGIEQCLGIAEPVKTPEIAKICGNCQSWQKDLVGDGTGIGKCLLNIEPAKVKWPGIPGCSSYEFNEKKSGVTGFATPSPAFEN